MSDDRLLPHGWSPDHPEAERTAPVGIEDDPDFQGGRDRVRYTLALAEQDVARIEVSLLYQTLGARWAAELLSWETPETKTFRRLYEQADRAPEVLATARWTR